MVKNFRYHDGADVYGWADSTPLNNKAIAAIKDPNGANANKEITSIPSPFARINLIKNAFAEVANSKLEGKTIFHKMVSDALDVGEILFNYDKFQDKIDIISWDPVVDLNNLLNSTNSSHQLLGKTLELYLKQDAKSNNFDKMKKLYLINYKNGVNPLNIIGGTSPASLFFTSANKFDLEGFQSGKDKFFDNKYCALQNRDPEYVKFLFALRKQLPNFSTDFKTVDDYFNEVFKILPQNLKSQINALNGNFYNNLSSLNIKGGGQVVEILGIPLKKGKGNVDIIKHNSDFRIIADKTIAGDPVLVLPNDVITGSYLYVTDSWDTTSKAPNHVKTPINQRTIPFDGTKYPYLTVSDLLEPVIIRTELPIDDFYFEKGGYEGDKSYLLPLKPLFFDYFSIDFLNKTINGNKAFEIKVLSGGNVEVFLRIPVQNGKHITFKRVYYNPVNQANKPDFNEEENKGAIVENRINLGITPFYKFPGSINPEYNIAFYDADFIPLLEELTYEISYYRSDNSKVNNVQKTQRRYKKEENINMFANIVQNNFDYIQLKHDFATGILIPKFKENVEGGSNQFSFAIDFGTTNTHIEYKLEGNMPEPFELTNKEAHHLGSLIDSKNNDEQFLKLLKEDVLPEHIQKDGLFNFPQRTVSAYHNKINFAQPIFSMGNITIPFKYEQSSFALNTKIKTNLKWNNDDNSEKVMKSFFEQLVKMIRDKILLNNGDLENTKIVWSYPASMLQFQLNIMRSQWTQIINQYIGSQTTINSICESLTPFYYYTKVEGRAALAKPLVTIDIGGGTSDVAIFKGDKPILFSSYRFAGDAIFGDNYNRNININGFVKKYHSKFTDLLNQNNLGKLTSVLDDIKSRNNSNDAINALFSIENNKQLSEKRIEISFLNQLKGDNDLKIVFLLFYVAQIYHLAKLIKEKGIEIPGGISFSGTASKLLTVLDDSPDKKTLTQFTHKVFEFVFEPTDTINIELILAENPKELTSKGALYLDGINLPNLNEIKEVLITNDTLLQSNPNLTYADISELEVKALKDYTEFLDFFFDLNRAFSFRDNFGIENGNLELTKEFLQEKKTEALMMGIKNKRDGLENADEEPITETLFFYPLVGSLGELAYKLSKK